MEYFPFQRLLDSNIEAGEGLMSSGKKKSAVSRAGDPPWGIL